MIKTLVIASILALSNLSNAGEWHGDVGKVMKVGGGEVTGMAGVGYRGDKYDVTLTYFAPGSVYTPDTPVPAWVQLSATRVFRYDWTFLGGHPELGLGLSFKSADRCAYNGEVDCNRRVPLPVNFHFVAGMEWDAVRIELFHDSNNAMDWGDEKKNLGVNWLTLSYRFN